MEKINIQKFIAAFRRLDPCDQLQLADAIVEELHKSDDLIEEDGFNRDLCGEVMPKLENYINNIGNSQKLDKSKDLINRFEKLPGNNQLNILEEILPTIEDSIEREEKFFQFDECRRQGHKFSEWIKTCDYKKLESHLQTEKSMDQWYRVCEKCRYIEKTYEKPKELIKK